MITHSHNHSIMSGAGYTHGLNPAGSVTSVGAIGAMGPGYGLGYGSSAGANGPGGPLEESHLLFKSSDNSPILKITKDGDVFWYGKPSKAADTLESVLGNIIDKKHSKSMRKRTYVNAYKSILEKAKSMDKNELIAFLEKSIQTREFNIVETNLKIDSDLDHDT